jgi:predicted lipoprotein with Yx(FWY)xxD motif
MSWLRSSIALGLAAAVLLAAHPAGAAGKPADVRVERTGVGDVVADANGMTLYVFVDDLLTSRPSACTGDCANDWIPALAPRKVTVGAGISGHVGTVIRQDGQRQLTMDGRPLYRFVGDRKPGDVRGNGIGNLWWAMTPTGLSATQYPVPTPQYGPAGPYTLSVVQTADGSVVADSRGQALYAYTDDTSTSSACVADWCMVDWPAVQANGTPTATPRISAPLTVMSGADGLAQVALGGHPLYTFAGDLRPGDIRGEGVGGDWFLVSPAGALVRPGGPG